MGGPGDVCGNGLGGVGSGGFRRCSGDQPWGSTAAVPLEPDRMVGRWKNPKSDLGMQVTRPSYKREVTGSREPMR